MSGASRGFVRQTSQRMLDRSLCSHKIQLSDAVHSLSIFIAAASFTCRLHQPIQSASLKKLVTLSRPLIVYKLGTCCFVSLSNRLHIAILMFFLIYKGTVTHAVRKVGLIATVQSLLQPCTTIFD
jgi:hypothetical protein